MICALGCRDYEVGGEARRNWLDKDMHLFLVTDARNGVPQYPVDGIAGGYGHQLFARLQRDVRDLFGG